MLKLLKPLFSYLQVTLIKYGSNTPILWILQSAPKCGGTKTVIGTWMHIDSPDE